MKIWPSIIIGLLLLGIPLGIGYGTAPCDEFGAPVLLVPHRWQEQRFLSTATGWLDQTRAVETVLRDLAYSPPPQSTGEAFRLAGRAGEALNRLDQLPPPEAPAAYVLLGLELARARDTYTVAAEQLLSFYGSNDPAYLAAAQTALEDAAYLTTDVRTGIAGLTYPLCREVWRGD